LDELEAHLRDQIAELDGAHLSRDEALLVAVKRMGHVDGIAREIAREYSGRLWMQLVLGGGVGDASRRPPGGLVEEVVPAAGAAVAARVARLAAGFPAEEPGWLLRNAGLLVLPFLACYFAWTRRLDPRRWLLAAAPFAVAAFVVNLYPLPGRLGHRGARRAPPAGRAVVRRSEERRVGKGCKRWAQPE